MIHEKYQNIVAQLENVPPSSLVDIKSNTKVDLYQCTVCGYIYDPNQGDQAHGIPANTTFGKLPNEWVCPICGAPKEMFIKVSD